MKILKLQDHLDSVPERWKKQYPDNGMGKDKIETYNELIKLKKPLDIDELKRLTNTSWTDFRCDVCDKNVDRLISIKPYHYDSYENRGLILCFECIDKINELKEIS